jgi:hypothetical protein
MIRRALHRIGPQITVIFLIHAGFFIAPIACLAKLPPTLTRSGGK